MTVSLDDECAKYIKSKFRETKEYIRRELDVLESITHQRNANKLLRQLPERVRMIIKEKTAMMKDDCSIHKPTYMEMVAKELDHLSTLYLWTDGTFGESVARTLKNLSKEFKPSYN